MAKYPDECVVVVMTDSGETRAREHVEAMKILGAARVAAAGLPRRRRPRST